jgi:hypothetical protein
LSPRTASVFKTVADSDGTIDPATGLQQINEPLSLPQTYERPELPADLAAVVAAWPSLLAAIRDGIVAMVKAASS